MSKGIKQDRKLIAAKQQYEISYIKERHGVPAKVTRSVMKKMNTHSRRKVYAELRAMGYTILTK